MPAIFAPLLPTSTKQLLICISLRDPSKHQRSNHIRSGTIHPLRPTYDQLPANQCRQLHSISTVQFPSLTWYNSNNYCCAWHQLRGGVFRGIGWKKKALGASTCCRIAVHLHRESLQSIKIQMRYSENGSALSMSSPPGARGVGYSSCWSTQPSSRPLRTSQL